MTLWQDINNALDIVERERRKDFWNWERRQTLDKVVAHLTGLRRELEPKGMLLPLLKVPTDNVDRDLPVPTIPARFIFPGPLHGLDGETLAMLAQMV